MVATCKDAFTESNFNSACKKARRAFPLATNWFNWWFNPQHGSLIMRGLMPPCKHEYKALAGTVTLTRGSEEILTTVDQRGKVVQQRVKIGNEVYLVGDVDEHKITLVSPYTGGIVGAGHAVSTPDPQSPLDPTNNPSESNNRDQARCFNPNATLAQAMMNSFNYTLYHQREYMSALSGVKINNRKLKRSRASEEIDEHPLGKPPDTATNNSGSNFAMNVQVAILTSLWKL